MYEKYASQGFKLIGFPSNQFGCQGPGTSEMEREAARRKFGFEFEVMDKIAVKAKPVRCKGIDPESFEEYKDDPDAMLMAPLVDDVTSSSAESPVYTFLKKAPFEGEIEWNYVKFLISRDGRVIRRYSPGDPLEQGLDEDIRRALKGEALGEKRRVSY
jgi:glutathione peroxidase